MKVPPRVIQFVEDSRGLFWEYVKSEVERHGWATLPSGQDGVNLIIDMWIRYIWMILPDETIIACNDPVGTALDGGADD